jgi:hypothetical protein
MNGQGRFSKIPGVIHRNRIIEKRPLAHTYLTFHALRDVLRDLHRTDAKRYPLVTNFSYDPKIYIESIGKTTQKDIGRWVGELQKEGLAPAFPVGRAAVVGVLVVGQQPALVRIREILSARFQQARPVRLSRRVRTAS